MVNRVASLSEEEKARGIVTWSAGNAAQGAAFAAAEAGTPCTVFMWATANPMKVAATRGYGAEVDLTAGDPAEAHERLLAYVEETGRTFVIPSMIPCSKRDMERWGSRSWRTSPMSRRSSSRSGAAG